MEQAINIEELKKQIEELQSQSTKLNEEIQTKRKEIEASEEYLQLSKKIDELGKREQDYDQKTIERKNLIASEFILTESDSRNTMPSYSQTFGKNIHDEVIKAIRKTFDFKRLSGSSIESIVSSMIDYKERNDKKLIQLKEKSKEISIENRQISENMQTLSNFLKELEKKYQSLINQIHQKKTQIANVVLIHGEGTMQDLKDVDVGFYTKKRSLEEYREECLRNFKKVF